MRSLADSHGTVLAARSSMCFNGGLRYDHFGRVVIDTCPSDEHHLVHSTAAPGDDRARCRKLIEELFREFEGLKGEFLVTVEFKAEEDA